MASESTTTTTTTTLALQCLEKMKMEILSSSSSSSSSSTTNDSLTFWRLQYTKINQALENFCNGPDWLSISSKTSSYGASSVQDEQATTAAAAAAVEAAALDDVHFLFSQLNAAMAEQEHKVWPDAFQTETKDQQTTKDKNNMSDVAVVFGGKYSSQPKSISETLISILVHHQSNNRVFTVSRSSSSSSSTFNVTTHLIRKNLDSALVEKGASEFQSVLQQARNEIENNDTTCPTTTMTTTASSSSSSSRMLTIYFTLGQHKGTNPFVRNIQAAQNFAKALEESLLGLQQQQQQQQPDDPSKIEPSPLLLRWKVVITGTDATLPSTTTYSNRSIAVGMENGSKEIIRIPSYHIMEYNFVYAISKLCQFYMIARAVVRLTRANKRTRVLGDDDDTGLKEEDLTTIIDKLQSHVLAVGEDGDYHPNDSRIGITIHTLSELDDISRRWTTVVEPAVSDHLLVAKDISICFTPLHAVPWTQQALLLGKNGKDNTKNQNDNDDNGSSSPKAYLVEQVVRRLKNAISIDLAAQAHLL
jgi:hypothetical protein